MPGYVPPPLRTGYLRRFAIYLGGFWIALAIGVAINADLASDLWLVARLAVGTVGLAALIALVRNNDDSR